MLDPFLALISFDIYTYTYREIHVCYVCTFRQQFKKRLHSCTCWDFRSKFVLQTFTFSTKGKISFSSKLSYRNKKKRRILSQAIIGSQTERADPDCENRKSDSALPNTLFSGTYRIMESRLNLSTRPTQGEGTNRGTARCDKILKVIPQNRLWTMKVSSGE